MQETFLSVYKHLDTINESSLKSYLATTAMNKSRDYLRKTVKHKKIPLEDIDDLSTEDNALSKAVNNELAEKLKDAVLSLKEPYRDVAKAYYLDGIPLVVYASNNGIKPKTAQTRLGRARDKLRTILRKEYGDG